MKIVFFNFKTFLKPVKYNPTITFPNFPASLPKELYPIRYAVFSENYFPI